MHLKMLLLECNVQQVKYKYLSTNYAICSIKNLWIADGILPSFLNSVSQEDCVKND